MTPEEIDRLLERPRTGILTTLDGDGWPHPAAMWFVPTDSGVSMWTYGKSQKAVNARRDPRAAFLVEVGDSYVELRGVMVRGLVEVIEDFEPVRDIGIALYERYTEPKMGIPVTEGPLAEIERQAHKRVGLRLPFTRVASWDHRRL